MEHEVRFGGVTFGKFIGIPCAFHTHACAGCGIEFSCRCGNPGDDGRDCGGCPIGDADIESYMEGAR